MIAKSERTKKIEAAEVDSDEDILTRGVRSVAKKIGYGASRAGDYVGAGANAVGDYLNPENIKDLNASQTSSKQKMLEAEDEKKRETRGVVGSQKEDRRYKPLFERFKSSEQEANERAQEMRRETRGVKKPLLQKFKSGGKVSSASMRADGCAQKGKTKGRMV